MNEQNHQQKTASFKDKLLNVLLVVAIILCIVAISLRLFIFSKIEVREASMAPTYADSDTFWINKLKPITRGCVAVFYKYSDARNIFDGFFGSSSELLVKRIVAVGGDKVWAELKNVDQEGKETYVLKIWCFDTGEVLDETNYLRGQSKVEIPEIEREWLGILEMHIGEDFAYEIPRGTFFAVGDNRNVSLDSRNMLGPIPIDRLLGVAIS